MDDWQEQTQELQALSAIYQEDFHIPGVSTPSGLSSDGDDPVASLAEAAAPPEGLEAQLLVKLSPATLPLPVQVGSSSGAQETFAAQISHLPPLSLHLWFPQDYPSSKPPEAQLSTFWLSGAQLKQLQAELDRLWQEQQGQPICFAWADWLTHSALEHLGISDLITLEPAVGVAHLAACHPPNTCAAADEAAAAAEHSQAAAVGLRATEPQQSDAGHAGVGPSLTTHRHHQHTEGVPTREPSTPEGADVHAQHPNRRRRRRGSATGNAAPSQIRQHSATKQQPASPPSQQAPSIETRADGHTHTASIMPEASQAASSSEAPQHATQASGPGAGGNAWNPEAVLMQMLQYDASQRAAEFCRQHWTCTICFEQVPGSKCLHAAACPHFFCTGCLVGHARSLLQEGAMERMQCPEPGCKQPLLSQSLAPHMAQEEAARWEQLELDAALLRMADVVFCKRCSTPCLEDQDNCAICGKCHFVFCSLCQESWHPGEQCMSTETRLKILRERMDGNKASAHTLVQQEFELMSLAAIEKSAKYCPVCNMAIQKQEGCNKMVCGSCGAYFCYRCGKAISGYEHFRDGGCVLFELSDIMRWEHELQQQINGHMGGEGQQAGRRPARAPDDRNQSSCPSCGQGNMRVSNNNHIACWACQQHYCFLCRVVLGRRGGGLHFGKRGGCQQHTPQHNSDGRLIMLWHL